MSVTATEYSEWLNALTSASCELVPTTFGFEECAVIEDDTIQTDTQAIGAFVPLVTHDGTIQVGVMTTPQACEKLARAFLGFEEDEAIEDEDVADAFREIANILAGMCKSSMKEYVSITNLGLPIIIKGCEQIIQENNANLLTMKWGEINCAVVVFEK